MTNPIKELKNICIQIGRMFRVKRNEALPALLTLALFITLNSLVAMRYAESFTKPHVAYWRNFLSKFCISGFDPLTYVIVSDWYPKYDIYRHPLLAFFVYPLYLLNSLLMDWTGLNLAMFLVMAILLFLVFYSFVFTLRICRDVVGLKNADAAMLSFFLFGCGYVMLTFIVPDHFAPSMFMLLMALYVCGVKLRDNKRLNGWQTMLMLIFTAGTTLTNGAKIVIDALYVDGKRFFRPRYMFCAIVIPSAIIWYFSRWEYRYYKWPLEMKVQKEKRQKSEKERTKNLIAFMDTTSIKDSTKAMAAFKAWDKQRIKKKFKEDHKQPWNTHKGKAMSKTGMLQYTDISTPRWSSIKENFFGESIQFHRKHLLEDTLKSRPVIVEYESWFFYAVEALILALFLLGVWCGRKSKFLWMTLTGFCVEIGIHIVLGFGLNEVYIMGAHWLFILPIAMAFALKEAKGKKLAALRTLIGLLAAYLLIYNATLLCTYLTA